MEIVNILNEVIQDNASAVSVENMRQQVEELSWGVQYNNLRSLVIDLQDKLEEMPPKNIHSRILDSRDCSLLVEDEVNPGRKSPTQSSTSRERDIVRKGIERLEKQIVQLIGIFISREQVNIA